MEKGLSRGGRARGGRENAAGKTPLRYLAPCTRGLEETVESELSSLGVTEVEAVRGGVLFAADRATARRVTLWTRTAVRILEPVASSSVRDFDELYEWTRRLRWEEFIGARRTFAVSARLTGSTMTDRRFASLRVKDGIVDRIRDRRGARPNVDRAEPDVPVRLVVRGTEALLFRDLAGESLHHRGYRPVQVKSPLAEGVAAALLAIAEWERGSLLDPMCGSGTFVIEAALAATRRAPGLARRFAAERFPDTDRRLWDRLREEARDLARAKLEEPILGVDRHGGALQIARGAAKRAGVADLVSFARGDAARFEPPFAPQLVVTNPPWGERLGEGDDLAASWRALGALLRRCGGATAFVLSGAPELTRHLGLRSSARHPLRIGAHDVRWMRYEIHPAR